MKQRHATTLGLGIATLILALSASACRAGARESSEDGSGTQSTPAAEPANVDPKVIEAASGATATAGADGVVRIGWSRADVEVKVDGMAMPPPAGLGSWAAFAAATDGGALVMGDTVVFRDEVDAAIDAAFANGLEITALHNHLFYDQPKAYFMHIGGHGEPAKLAAGVKAMWDAIREVRAKNPQPAERFGGPIPQPAEGGIDPQPIERATGLKAAVNPGGVIKVSVGLEARMHGTAIAGSMGLTTWAAFSGTDALAAIDGDFAMRAGEVTPVLRALRQAGFHIVALHNHMIGEEPGYYFTHFWSVGPVAKLAEGFKAALDAQQGTKVAAADGAAWSFDEVAVGELPEGWKVEGTNQRGRLASWSVKTDTNAASPPNVLALTDTSNSGGTFNLAWTDRVAFADGLIEVKIKAGTGREDQGGGPIWRARDKDNYYVARWNPLEDNFRLYYVKEGHRVQLDSARVRADPEQWHTIRVETQGDQIRCGLDGQMLLEATDATFPEAGGVGLWTKADAATSFDDLTVSPSRRSTSA